MLAQTIWREVLHIHNISQPLAPMTDVMGPDPHNLYKYHKVKAHHTNDYYQLKKEIKYLI